MNSDKTPDYVKKLLNKPPEKLTDFERTYLGLYKVEVSRKHKIMSDCYPLYKFTPNYYLHRLKILSRYEKQPYLLLKCNNDSLAMIYKNDKIKLLCNYSKSNLYKINSMLRQLHKKFIKKVDFPLDNYPKTIKLNSIR